MPDSSESKQERIIDKSVCSLHAENVNHCSFSAKEAASIDF